LFLAPLLVSFLTASALLWGFVFVSGTIYKNKIQSKVDKFFGRATNPDGGSDEGLINIKNNADKWRFFNKLDTRHLLSKREQKIVEDGVEGVRITREVEAEQEVQNGSATGTVEAVATTTPDDETPAEEVEAVVHFEEEDAEETDAEIESAVASDHIESDDTVHGIN